MVAKITIHGDQEIVVLVNGVAHGGKDGRAQAQLSWPVQDTDMLVGRSQFISQLTCTVGGIIIDDIHISSRQDQADGMDQGDQVVPFIVGSNGNQDAGYRG